MAREEGFLASVGSGGQQRCCLCNNALFAKAGKQSPNETHFSSQTYEYLQLLSYGMAMPEEECVRATAPVLQMVGSEQPYSMGAAVLGRRSPGGQPARCFQKWPTEWQWHTETRQVLVIAWDFDLGPQSWQETVVFASSLTPGQ